MAAPMCISAIAAPGRREWISPSTPINGTNGVRIDNAYSTDVATGVLHLRGRRHQQRRHSGSGHRHTERQRQRSIKFRLHVRALRPFFGLDLAVLAIHDLLRMAKTRKLEDAGIPQPILAAGPKACAVWNHFMTDESLKPSTNRIYLLAVVQFLRWLATNHISLNSLTPEHIHAFNCRPGATSVSGRNYRTPLRRFLSKLALEGIVSPGLGEQSFPSVGKGSRRSAADEPSLRVLKASVKRLAPGLGRNSAEFAAALVLLAADQMRNTEVRRISEVTGNSAEESQGVWRQVVGKRRLAAGGGHPGSRTRRADQPRSLHGQRVCGDGSPGRECRHTRAEVRD